MTENEAQTRELALRLEIEEAQAWEERISGKARAGSRITDEQLALQVHLDELQQLFQIMGDDHLARSISNAMGADADILALYQEMDRMEIADRALAMSLSRPGSVNLAPMPTAQTESPSVSLRSFGRTDQTRVPRVSSASTSTPLINEACAICMDPIGRKTHLRVPCGHFYDEKCLVSFIQRASKDETTYPPRCCKKIIPEESFLPFLGRGVRVAFQKSAAEFSTRPRDRVYCSTATCSEFLGVGSQGSTSRSMQCPRCAHSTCSVCHAAAHPPTRLCKREETNSVIQALLEEKQWQRCPECHSIIELTQGCYHITCRCKAEFCYACASEWKSCECPQWEERHLLAEAERRVDAEIMEEAALPVRVRTVAPVAERQARIANMTSTLRQNHVCNHSWRVQQGGGDCENCGKYWNRYRLRCTNCYMDVCVPCARNRM